jgi:transcriptional regulator with XRE-family HTH domain
MENAGPRSIALFGQYFKKMRQKRGLTLRKFCFKYGRDPGNISKLERGVIAPPRSREKLEEYASFLGIKEGTDEWYNYFDLAAACSGNIPHYVMDDDSLVERLPLVFRTLRGEKVPKDKLKELAELIRKT